MVEGQRERVLSLSSVVCRLLARDLKPRPLHVQAAEEDGPSNDRGNASLADVQARFGQGQRPVHAGRSVCPRLAEQTSVRSSALS